MSVTHDGVPATEAPGTALTADTADTDDTDDIGGQPDGARHGGDASPSTPGGWSGRVRRAGSRAAHGARRLATAARRRPLQVALLALPVVVLALAAWDRRWTTDDAFINYRVIDQVFAGNGPVFNAGVRVEVGTSVAWLYWLVGLRAVLGWLVPVEWLGALSGIGFALAGVVGITAGAARLARLSGRTGLLVPAGALLVAAVPPFWDFTTSGLENGMVFGWIGLCFAALAARAARVVDADTSGTPRPSPARPWWLPALIGLAPLIRPELVIVAGPLFVALLATSSPGWRESLRALAYALALPVLYEIFRMGYYASLVPNTALAKEGVATRVDNGWEYLVDFAQPYALVVPLALLAVLAALTIRPGRRRGVWAVALAPAGGGLLYLTYVVVIGGDYMHGRMALAPVFALVAPVACVALPTRAGLRSLAGAAVVAGAVAVAMWAVVCWHSLRAPNDKLALDMATADERGFWVDIAGVPNPVTVEQYYRVFGSDEPIIAGLADRGADVFFYHGFLPEPLQLALPKGSGVWVQQWPMGIQPFRMGTDVNFTDIEGLVDPIGSRLELQYPRKQRPGHEKNLYPEVAVAELGGHNPNVAGDAAVRFINCSPIVELQQSIRDPLTPSLFVTNLTRAPGFTRLRVPTNPVVAEQQFCAG